MLVTHFPWHFWPHISIHSTCQKGCKMGNEECKKLSSAASDYHKETPFLSTSPEQFPPSLSLILIILFDITNNIILILFQINLSSLPTPTRWLTEARCLGPVSNPVWCSVYVIFTDVTGPSGSFRYYLNKPHFKSLNQLKIGFARARTFLFRFLHQNNSHEPLGHLAEAPNIGGKILIGISSNCSSSTPGKV